MADDRSFERNTTRQRLVAALILLLVAPLAIGFNTRLSAIQRIRQDEVRLKRAVADAQLRQAELQSLRAFVTSDAYVEHWARVDARMARPGEVAVIPVAPETVPADSPVPAQQHVPSSILDEWWAVFFEPSIP